MRDLSYPISHICIYTNICIWHICMGISVYMYIYIHEICAWTPNDVFWALMVVEQWLCNSSVNLNILVRAVRICFGLWGGAP